MGWCGMGELLWPFVAVYTVGVVAYLVHLHAPDKSSIEAQRHLLELLKAKVDSHTTVLHQVEEGEDEVEAKLNRLQEALNRVQEALTRLENRLNAEAQPARAIPWPPGLK